MNKPDDYDLIPRTTQPGASGAPGQAGSGAPYAAAGGQPGATPQSPYAQPGATGGSGSPGAPRSPYGAPDPEPPRRSWAWLITLGVVAFVAFAGGAALFTLRDRLGPAQQAPTPAAPATSATPGVSSELTPSGFLATLAALTTQTPAAAATPGAGTPNPVATLAAMATATAQARALGPTLTPSPTLQPAPTATATPCPIPVAAGFAGLLQQNVLGCPLAEMRVVWSAAESFERGAMLWRSDTNRSYLFSNDGRWQVIDASWDGQTPPGRGEPPAGLLAPERGFGYAWGTQDEIFARLGWARDIERGFCAEVQEFEQGFLLQSSPVASCTADNLYNQAASGDWQPLVLLALNSGNWSSSITGAAIELPTAVAAVSPTAPTAAGTLSVATRPEANGVFSARSTAGMVQPIVVDGALDDWPADNWQSISHAIEGTGRYSGPKDAAGEFNLIWSTQGLMLGVRVVDDQWRPGPLGTDLWQGDALELHLDTRLADDYGSTTADTDDYQLGIAPTGNGGALQAYRWLPLDAEGVLAVQGQAIAGGGGYTLEVLLPWSHFGIDSPQPGASFGFNLSISDNDSDTQSQESVISASPTRTTFNNPTEWGTLVLLP